MSDRPDLAIISRHEKGFWQGDLYLDAPQEGMEEMGLAPDAFFTLTALASEDDARRRAAELWPTAKIVVAEDDEDEDEA